MTGGDSRPKRDADDRGAPAIPQSSPYHRMLQSAAVSIALIAIAVRLLASLHTHSVGEDALITLRYAENLAAGRGWAYNPGEHVLGTTTPLFTVILAAASLLRMPGMPAGIGLSILADGATCFLIFRLLARPEFDRPVAGLFAAAVYALSTTPISISISGMETALVTCAGMAAVYAYVAGRWRAMCLWGAVLFLFRIDGLLLFVLLLAGAAFRIRRIPWAGIGLFLLVIAPWILFATLYFGSPIPESVIAKWTVYSGRGWSPGVLVSNAEAFRTQFLLGWPQRLVTLAFAIGAAATVRDFGFWILDFGFRKRAENEKQLLPEKSFGLLLFPLLWLSIYYGTMLVSHVPAFPWYFLPPWPMFLTVAVLGVDTVLGSGGKLRGARLNLPNPPTPFPAQEEGDNAPNSQTASQTGRVPNTAHPLTLSPPHPFTSSPHHPITPSPHHPQTWLPALALLTVAGLVHVRSVERDIAAAQVLEDSVRRPIGLWLRANAVPSDRVLLEPIGYVGYYSRIRVLDMIGLVSPEVLPFYRGQNTLSGIVAGLRPEWLCLRRGERDLLYKQNPALLQGEYVLVKEFPTAVAPAFYLYKARPKGRLNSSK